VSSKKGRRDSVEDPRLAEAARLLGELADEQCDPDATFAERSAAAGRVAEAMLADAFEPGGKNDGDEREDPERKPK